MHGYGDPATRRPQGQRASEATWTVTAYGWTPTIEADGTTRFLSAILHVEGRTHAEAKRLADRWINRADVSRTWGREA